MAGTQRKEEIRFTREHEHAFMDFLRKDPNPKRLDALLSEGKHRFTVNLDELRQVSLSMVQALIADPTSYIAMMSNCLKQTIDEIEKEDPSIKEKGKSRRYPPNVVFNVNFEGNFGRNHITPRGLTASNLGQLVQVRGIVTRLSLIRPYLETSVHYCEDCKQFQDWNYDNKHEINSKRKDKVVHTIPVKDFKGHPLQTEFGLCSFKDWQKIVLQEMPERTPAGQLPRSIEVWFNGDLVDKAKPGDRIDVVGVYRAVAKRDTGKNGIFETTLLAVGLTQINEVENANINEIDIKRIQEISKDKDVFEKLSASIAPSIEGHKYIKQALLLQLLGGIEKTLDSGTHLRGDINILLVGDPSTGKSQLLRNIMNLAALSVSTTGRGSTGVGLTAAVIGDKETGERHLEAGAMVLGDRGIVCIDEFDKMSDIDRVAIHEVMEQQTVTIAKAGIYTSLNARCSVLAAANPIYGEYAVTQPLNKNIGLPDSLLSRFDLLFITLDKKEPENDRTIAKRVILNHRYKGDGDGAIAGTFWSSEDTIVESDLRAEEEEKEASIFEKHSGFLYGGKKTDVISKNFLKKYIAYAKKRSQPRLSNDAVNYVSKAWASMRLKENAEKTLPITVRTLETLIRLATAHAKCRIADEVTIEDCQVVERLLNFAIFREDPELQAIPEPMEVDIPNGKKTKSKSKASKSKKDTETVAITKPEEESKIEPMEDVKKIGSTKKKVDIDEEVKDVITAKHTGRAKITEEEKKFVYKIVAAQANLDKLHNCTSVKAVWAAYQKILVEEKPKVVIENEEELLEILKLLDDKGHLTVAENGVIALV